MVAQILAKLDELLVLIGTESPISLESTSHSVMDAIMLGDKKSFRKMW